MIRHIYANRNHSREAITCKLGTIVATAIWSLMAIYDPDAIARAAYAGAAFGHPRIAGGAFTAISVLQFRWLWTGRDPIEFVEVGSYVLQFALWIGILIYLLFDSPRDPAAIAGVGTVVCLAWWAFVCGALRSNRDAVVG